MDSIWNTGRTDKTSSKVLENACSGSKTAGADCESVRTRGGARKRVVGLGNV